MPRFRSARPATAVPAAARDDVDVELLTLLRRRARAFERVWPLLSTSIPTTDIVESYLDEILQP